MSSLMNVTNISKSFGGNHVLENISFSLEKGEILGLLGPNGSGKSTLLNVISGFTPADGGQIALKDVNVEKCQPHEIIRTGIARTFQLPSMPSKMSVLEVVMAADTQQHNLWQNLFKTRAMTELDVKIKHKAKAILEELLLTKVSHLPASAISGGQKKLLGIACALMGEPDVLMLDEPMAGVHPNLRKSIVDTLVRLNSKGLSLIIIEHDMQFIRELCHRCIVLNRGDIVADCLPEDLSKNKEVLSAYLGGNFSEMQEAV
ncbi:ABC transporter ATP-binding protein [Vibrio sp.]|uniref:ABC transporter ATP-binding protein n=1 Tax=Vibrio viridaestus TaxID=2487322 RepID=A0A3N9TB93_9VIBR|nr:ABC transporter ATP-binding protein [Vibrio viridaestus]MDC0610031.1 ABC transporter ATP-binding protein [Vibrio sp.]RQW61371.1 ABC transporter ATP-binding protein [Vibrio viridaestus]